jgi:hypothetical protein
MARATYRTISGLRANSSLMKSALAISPLVTPNMSSPARPPG